MAKQVYEKVFSIVNHQGKAKQTAVTAHLLDYCQKFIKITGVGKDVEVRLSSSATAGNRHWYSHYGNQ